MKMKWSLARAVSVVLTLTLAALAGQAHAACGSGQRIDVGNAECLSAEWNKNTSQMTAVTIQNLCSHTGDLVAKIDSKNSQWPESTSPRLTDGNPWQTFMPFGVKAVYCCEDLSDLCNRSDIADACLDGFMQSPANAWCNNVSAGVDSNDQCVITAECRDANANFPSVSVTAKLSDVDDLRNCSGSLEVAGCPFIEVVP